MKDRQPLGAGECIPISVMRHPYSIVELGVAWRACAPTAIGTRKDLRFRCQSQSICAQGREGERARMEQMEPDKKGRVLLKRARETGD